MLKGIIGIAGAAWLVVALTTLDPAAASASVTTVQATIAGTGEGLPPSEGGLDDFFDFNGSLVSGSGLRVVEGTFEITMECFAAASSCAVDLTVNDNLGSVSACSSALQPTNDVQGTIVFEPSLPTNPVYAGFCPSSNVFSGQLDYLPAPALLDYLASGNLDFPQ